VSLGYLSEVERGRKEASSELLAAICDALAVPLAEVLFDVSESMADASGRTASVAQRTDRDAAAETAAAARIGGDTRIVIPAPTTRALAAA
jgi:transcriptional regulator with XRE-family HTH domain